MEICHRDVTADPAGGSCPDCGHAGLAHPGIHNPRINTCQLCELAAAMATDPATYDLPREVDYDALITMLKTLLPGLDPTRVSRITMDHRQVTVTVWTGTEPNTLLLPITHVQGSATEGGQTP